MYGLDKNFAAPHTGIVLAVGELVAPVVYTLAALLLRSVKMILSVVSYIMLPTKKLSTVAERAANAPHVALVMVPGNFVTGAFKSW
ncbi:MAG: hypothetical protein HQ483_12680 [Rhodospirillales bacterium]|nr:hypothetical protein [Rhodospirillales bacterium]